MKSSDPVATLLFHLRALGIDEPSVREFVFAAERKRKFAFDVAFPVRMLAVEIEGGLFGIGPKCRLCGRRAPAGHSSIERLKSDLEKYNLAVMLGWRVLRYTPEQVESGHAARDLFAALKFKRRADCPSDGGEAGK